ncbi:MAG TPA: hypothetical protein VGF67_03690, partial [Ktedonobacteraceae bacterium]
MPVDQRSIFRAHALHHYRLRRQQDVLPRLSAPPSFALLWIVLVLSLLGGLLAWSIRLPFSIPAAGVLIAHQPAGQLQVLLFVPGDQQETLRAGQAVQLDLGPTGPHLSLAISSLSPRVLSPAQIRAQYHLDSTL